MIVLMCMPIFQEKLCFWRLGWDIYCWWIKLLSLFDLCCLKTWRVWISGMKNMRICGMRLTVDKAINDFNWYVVMLMFMMIMWIRNKVVVVDNVIEMRWCLCWEWYWNGMLMMLGMHWHVHVVYVHGGVHWPCRMSLVWETRVVKEFKHFWGHA